MTGQAIETHAVVAAVCMYVIQALKHWKAFPLITPDTKTLNRIVGALVALFSGLGVHAQFDAAAGTLVVSGLVWASMTSAASSVIVQWVTQQFFYDLVLNKPKMIAG